MANQFKPTPVKGIQWICQLDLKGLWFLIVGRTTNELSDQALVKKLEDGLSFIRWGDGETANLRGKSSWHQGANSSLSMELSHALDYMQNDAKLILGLPLVAIKGNLLRQTAWPFWKIKILLATRVLLNTKNIRTIPEDKISDAEFWYRNFSSILKILLSLEIKHRPVLLISGNESHLDALASICNVHFYQIPAVNAFAQYEEIQNFTVRWCDDRITQRPIVLLAAGSVGKLLIMHLTSRVQVIDIGSGLSALLSGKIERDWILDPRKFDA